MINIQQNEDKYEVRFRYDKEIVELIKNVPGKSWNPDQKFWTIPKDRLGMLLAQFKATPYENQVRIVSDEHLNENAVLAASGSIPENIDLSDVHYRIQDGCKPFKHQIDSMKYYKGRRSANCLSGFILADEPGCISGDAHVRIRREGTTWTRECRLSNLYHLWTSGQKFHIKTMCNDRFVYLPIYAVLDKGVKQTVKITTNTTSLVCTPDHEIFTSKGWIAASELQPGDVVYTNGDPVCPKCGSTENIITSKDSKFQGFCRKCMYSLRDGTKFKDDKVYKELDSHGYVRLKGKPTRTWPLYKFSNGEGIYEHHQVWYEHTGHIVDTSKEAIHHKDHVKTNNDFENLELLSHSDHGKKHIDSAINNLPQNQNIDFHYCRGVKIWSVPHPSEVISVEPYGEDHVYDVTIDHPEIHNFIANDVIVHNCGKTLQITNLAIYKKETQGSKHCLIITCVNSAKYNWRDDIDKHTNGEFEGYILGTRLKRNGEINDNATSLGKLEDLITEKKYGGKKSDESLPYFLILNIEALRFKKGKNYLITEELIRKINEGYIDMIAIDEIHVNASPSSTQGSQLLALKNKSTRRIEWFPMTGTPITNKPTDLFTPLRLIDAHRSTSYWSWCQQFCIYGGIGGHDIIGYKNVASLKAMLEPNMLRRLKKDILDLPEKINNVVYVENSSYQDKLYSQVQSGILSQRDEIIHSMNPMTELLKLRQVNGSPELIDEACKVDKDYINKNAKMKTLISMIENVITNTDEKLIVFSMFVEPLRTLYRLIGNKYKVCSYTGTMSQAAREQQKHQFINDPNCRILIGTYQALGTSHTLVAANNVFFYDEAWVPTTMQQAEDRVHRPGQTNTVNLYRLITKDTIDEHVHKILYKKKGISSYIVDNIDIRSNPELFDLLLSH